MFHYTSETNTSLTARKATVNSSPVIFWPQTWVKSDFFSALKHLDMIATLKCRIDAQNIRRCNIRSSPQWIYSPPTNRRDPYVTELQVGHSWRVSGSGFVYPVLPHIEKPRIYLDLLLIVVTIMRVSTPSSFNVTFWAAVQLGCEPKRRCSRTAFHRSNCRATPIRWLRMPKPRISNTRRKNPSVEIPQSAPKTQSETCGE